MTSTHSAQAGSVQAGLTVVPFDRGAMDDALVAYMCKLEETLQLSEAALETAGQLGGQEVPEHARLRGLLRAIVRDLETATNGGSAELFAITHGEPSHA